MSNLAVQSNAALIEQVLIKGDLSKLTEMQRVDYYRSVCESVGLNPLTKPFEYILLNSKLVLYALRAATDQLRKLHKVSIKITAREQIGEVYVVTAQASLADGRCDESTGAVSIKGLSGDNLANAYLKCETKAKRRVTLSICGLGLLDETEVETIKEAKSAPKQIVNHAVHLGTARAQALRQDLAPPIEPSSHIEAFSEANQGHNGIGQKIIQVGKKYKGMTFESVGINDVKSYVNYVEGESIKSGRPVTAEFQTFLNDAYDYIAQAEAL